MKILIYVILGLDLLYIVVMCRHDERYPHYLHIPQEKL